MKIPLRGVVPFLFSLLSIAVVMAVLTYRQMKTSSMRDIERLHRLSLDKIQVAVDTNVAEVELYTESKAGQLPLLGLNVTFSSLAPLFIPADLMTTALYPVIKGVCNIFPAQNEACCAEEGSMVTVSLASSPVERLFYTFIHTPGHSGRRRGLHCMCGSRRPRLSCRCGLSCAPA
eukprot:NODE_1231_length_1043_cov_57.566398_g943_i0.p1 GENE.NODE_1231_length_1043_cov_57.566398_g943_i0~~NODE_1231_length_1043_cov_57.566398_g943_i0.p1  ORF type:complete len:202 (-),score=32.77 NODE_1231_length_1043_cov_57.566398_g943_i0:438-962(-)